MPPSRKSKKSKRASTTDKNNISKNSLSNDQKNTPTNPVLDPFQDPDPSTGSPLGYESSEQEDAGSEGCFKSDGKRARKDDREPGSNALMAKSGRTMDVRTAILELRQVVAALDTITRECIARCNDLERDGELDANKLSTLEELVTFLAFKMDAQLEIANHIRALGGRPLVTAEHLYRAGLWQHDVFDEFGNGSEQPSATELPNTGTDQEPSPSSQTSPVQRDDRVAPMSSSSDEPIALVKADSATNISIASLLNDDPTSRYQRSSQPPRNYDAERADAELRTAEEHNHFLAEIGKLKQQMRAICTAVAKCNDASAILTENAADRTESIASIERRVGFLYLVSRPHVGDQKAPDDVWGNPISKEISNTGEPQGSYVKAMMDAVLLDSTNLGNDNDTSESQEKHCKSVTNDSTAMTSLDNVTQPQLHGKFTREGNSIGGPQGGRSKELVEDISTITQNISQDQQLDEEKGKRSNGSLKYLSEEIAHTSKNKIVHEVIEGQKLQKAEPQRAGPQQDVIEEIVRLNDEMLQLQSVVREANGSEEFENGSSEERACTSSAEAFLRNLGNSWTELEKAMGGELTEDLMKENAYLTEKMNVLAAVDLHIEDSRLKLGVMQDAAESQLDQIRSPENGTSIGKALVEDPKPDQKSIKLDENKRSDSQKELRPHDITDRIEKAPSHGIRRHPNLIEEGNTASGGLQHQVSKDEVSLSILNLKPNSAGMPGGLLATEDAALILASIKTQGHKQPRQPFPVNSIENQQPTKDYVHDKSMSQDLSTSQRICRTSQPGKQNGDSGSQGEILKTKPQVEFKRAVMEDFHGVIFLSQLKDGPQPPVDRSEPAPADVAEDEGQVKNDREQKHDGQPRKDDSSTANTREMPPRLNLNNSTRDSELIINDKDENPDEYCQLEDVVNDTKAAKSAIFNNIIKLTAQGEIVKEEEDSVVGAKPQEEPSCTQSSSTAEKAKEARDRDYDADSEPEVKGGGKTAILEVTQEVEYEYYGCDHPFL